MRQEILDLVSDFELMEDWLDKYNHLIELADDLPPFADSLKVPENLIEGCQSRVWLSMSVDSAGNFVLAGYSDAVIVSGIVALLVVAFGGMPVGEVAGGDFSFLERIGLMQNLSQSRRQGLQSMLDLIVEFSKSHS